MYLQLAPMLVNVCTLSCQVLGEQNLAMIELARSRGCAAKFTGSGGAVLVLCPDGQGQAEELEAQASKAGFTLISAVLACKSKTSALNQ